MFDQLYYDLITTINGATDPNTKDIILINERKLRNEVHRLYSLITKGRTTLLTSLKMIKNVEKKYKSEIDRLSKKLLKFEKKLKTKRTKINRRKRDRSKSQSKRDNLIKPVKRNKTPKWKTSRNIRKDVSTKKRDKKLTVVESKTKKKEVKKQTLVKTVSPINKPSYSVKAKVNNNILSSKLLGERTVEKEIDSPLPTLKETEKTLRLQKTVFPVESKEFGESSLYDINKGMGDMLLSSDIQIPLTSKMDIREAIDHFKGKLRKSKEAKNEFSVKIKIDGYSVLKRFQRKCEKKWQRSDSDSDTSAINPLEM